jgi:hypothetical protein
MAAWSEFVSANVRYFNTDLHLDVSFVPVGRAGLQDVLEQRDQCRLLRLVPRDGMREHPGTHHQCPPRTHLEQHATNEVGKPRTVFSDPLKGLSIQLSRAPAGVSWDITQQHPLVIQLILNYFKVSNEQGSGGSSSSRLLTGGDCARRQRY